MRRGDPLEVLYLESEMRLKVLLQAETHLLDCLPHHGFRRGRILCGVGFPRVLEQRQSGQQVEQLAKSILLVEVVQEGTEAEHHPEEHDGVGAGGVVGALEQPQSVAGDLPHGSLREEAYALHRLLAVR